MITRATLLVWQSSVRRLRFNRTAKIPATGPSAIFGKRSAVAMRPSQNPELVISQASHATVNRGRSRLVEGIVSAQPLWLHFLQGCSQFTHILL